MLRGTLKKRKKQFKNSLASRMAEKSQKKIKKASPPSGQMNAHDRRIVHIHLKRWKTEIRTQSIGDGYYRKIDDLPPKKRGSSRGKYETILKSNGFNCIKRDPWTSVQLPQFLPHLGPGGPSVL